MRIFSAWLVVLTLFANAARAATLEDPNAKVDSRFLSYVAEQGKHYSTTKEMTKRQKLWQQTDDFIKNYNPKGFTMEHNEFSDWTEEEKKSLLGVLTPDQEAKAET